VIGLIDVEAQLVA
jgi:hypothetical protein